MVFMGVTAAIAKEAHIRVTFIIERLPEKVRCGFELFACGVIFLFNLIIFLGSIELMNLNWGQQAVTFAASVGILYLAIAVSSFFILLFTLAHGVKWLKRIFFKAQA
jgi:TRAP-type C4-dicarboxylate transport system permease small subunit